MMQRRCNEPLIVVEETGNVCDDSPVEETEEKEEQEITPPSDLLLLSPYRDLRKRSLPTAQVTHGITASQVRRLSEQGGEGGRGPSPLEAAFLATLSAAPPTTASTGRRHSVVTISKVPKTTVLFGRNRRESFAAFSVTGGGRPIDPPCVAHSPSGSDYNLQLDIMDDIAEIKAARKARLKMWRGEELCEVEEGGESIRYHRGLHDRRFSDVTGLSGSLAAGGGAERRASAFPGGFHVGIKDMVKTGSKDEGNENSESQSWQITTEETILEEGDNHSGHQTQKFMEEATGSSAATTLTETTSLISKTKKLTLSEDVITSSPLPGSSNTIPIQQPHNSDEEEQTKSLCTTLKDLIVK